MFDCVLPTRIARHSCAMTSHGRMILKNKEFEKDFTPLDPESDCFVDRVYTKAYLRHLFVSDELLAMQIASIHNLAFYLRLVKMARQHIIDGDFSTWKAEMVKKLSVRL